MNWRRVVFWVAVLCVATWVISNPAGAGHAASHLVLRVVGAGQQFMSAAVSFVSSL